MIGKVNIADLATRLGKKDYKGPKKMSWLRFVMTIPERFVKSTSSVCRVCGKGLVFNNESQVVFYCSKAHRVMRHNRQKFA